MGGRGRGQRRGAHRRQHSDPVVHRLLRRAVGTRAGGYDEIVEAYEAVNKTLPPGERRDVSRSRTQEQTVVAEAGEKAHKTGDFYCASCDEKVHAEEGEKIPECPNGHKSFETRRNEPGNKS